MTPTGSWRMLDSTQLTVAGHRVGAAGAVRTRLMTDVRNRSITAVTVGGNGTGDSTASPEARAINVLLADANASYSRLRDLAAINPVFPKTSMDGRAPWASQDSPSDVNASSTPLSLGVLTGTSVPAARDASFPSVLHL